MKKVIGQVKLQIPGGRANPSPPVGPALGQHGVNIGEFVKQFNTRTAKDDGTLIPVIITIFADRSFAFVTKTPPASVLLAKVAGVEKGSGEPNKTKIGRVTMKQVRDIAQQKLADLNTEDLEAAVRTVIGTARSMGMEVEGVPETMARAPAGDESDDKKKKVAPTPEEVAAP